LLSVIGSLLLQGLVIYHPFFYTLMHTVPLCMEYLLLSIAFAALPSVFSFFADAFSAKKNEKNNKKRRK